MIVIAIGIMFVLSFEFIKFGSQSLKSTISTSQIVSQKSPSTIKPNQPEEGTTPWVYLPSVLNKFPSQSVFGVTFLPSLNEPNSGFSKFQAGEVSWTRIDVYWAAIEQNEGTYTWDTNFEQNLILAANNNIKPIIVVDGTPKWALKSGYTTCGPIAQDKFAVFGNFLNALVQRYSAPPFTVQYWEIYNEPDAPGLMGCWGNPTDTLYFGGYYYGEMLKVAYTSIKQANPGAQVLVGGLLMDCDPDNPPTGKSSLCTMSRFLEGILESEKPNAYFDGVSFHGYDYYQSPGVYINSNWNAASNTTGPVSIVKSEYLKKVLAQYGFNNKYLISTEQSLSYGGVTTCATYVPPEVQSTKVEYVIHTYTAAIAQGWKAAIYFSAAENACKGLMNPDLTPLPAFYAYEFAEKKLNNVDFVRDVTEFPEVRGYVFLNGDRTLWVVWSNDLQDHSITLNSMPVEINRVISATGIAQTEANATTVTVNADPLFIEFSP